MNVNRYTNARPIMTTNRILNVYQLNIYQISLFMFKYHNSMTPKVFNGHFSKITHRYPTRHSFSNLKIPWTKLRLTDFSITCRGPRIWNAFLTDTLKNSKTLTKFKSSIKQKLLNSDNELTYF